MFSDRINGENRFADGLQEGSVRVQCGPGMHWLLSKTSLPRLGGGVRSQKSIQTPQTRESAAQPKPRLLRFQERIKGPKNASIARFDGLCCYQTSSEISDVFRAGSMAKTDSQTGFKKVRCGFNAGRACTGCFRKPVCPDLAAESEARKAFKRRKHAKAQPSPSPVCFDFRSE